MTFPADAITPALVAQLLAEQFPHWADLPITPAVPQGWDNRTFRLGDELSVRLPSAQGYTPQVEKEHRWLPYLAPRLPLPIPVPLAQGAPGAGYPWPWSVYRWLAGRAAQPGHIADLSAFAADLAVFLNALQQIDPAGGPPPGPHSFFRGAPLDVYDDETRRAISAVCDLIDADAATRLWEAGLATPFHRPPVWFHGDVAANNLLVREGRLSAVIDFGCCGVGDPACDLVIAWTRLFALESGLQALGDEAPSDPLHCRDTDLHGLSDPGVLSGRAAFGSIGLEQNTGVALGCGAGATRSGKLLQLCSLVSRQLDQILLIHVTSPGNRPDCCSQDSRSVTTIK
ncbi:MAG TPA: aminoglycoside phosphotransferase family protein [Chloroflexaceae bacterium]|nr:aminoglycoside phosphotransferase family protein [Chloroflexaceae bacterium]